jgi:hypothetical protein
VFTDLAGFTDFAAFVTLDALAAIPASDIARIRVYHGPAADANSWRPFGNSRAGHFDSV